VERRKTRSAPNKSPGRCRGFEFYPFKIGSVFRADRTFAPIEFVIQAEANDVNAMKRSVDGGTGKGRGVRVYLVQSIVQVFSPHDPMGINHVLNARSEYRSTIARAKRTRRTTV
jgi:hypothetical protein